MKTSKTPKTAVPRGTENSALAQAWTAWFNNKQTRTDDAALGQSVDALLRRKLPDGALGEVFHGAEADIRQNAAEALFGRFLAGNHRLIAATAAGEIDIIADEIDRSVFTALRYSERNHRRLMALEAGHRLMLEEAALTGSLPMPAASGTKLPEDVRMKLALAGLALALKGGKVSADNAAIAESVLVHSKSQSEIAHNAGVSPAAISQRMKKTAAAVRALIENVEVEL